VHDLKSLSEQVSTQVQTLELETGKLNSTVIAFENVDQEFSQGMSRCSLQHQQAAQNVSMYDSQIEVLKLMAKPSSPYTHTAIIEWPPVAPSLLENGLWTREHCLAFVNFTQHHENLLQGMSTTDCDANRDELHKACSAMYISVRALAQVAREQSEDKTCDQKVKRKKNDQLLPLVSQRRQQVSHIKLSSEKLDALAPLLRHLNDSLNNLDAEVVKSVHPECAASDVAIVPETLHHMHELIHSLQECPSHNDVVDRLPKEETPKHVAHAVCGGDGDCGTAEPIVHNETSLISNPVHVQAIMSWGGELE
jgi:hypothetical protein